MIADKYLIIRDNFGKTIQKIDIDKNLLQSPPYTNYMYLDGSGSPRPRTIDLSALSNYQELVYLSFSGYPNLEVPNLYPLYNNKNLEGIHVNDDCPRMVEEEWDITPLFESLRYQKLLENTQSFRPRPRKYFLGYNVTVWLHPQDFDTIHSMLYNPINHNHARVFEVRYKPLEEIKDWGQIRRLLWEVRGKTCHITAQHSVLNGLGLSHYGFVESDLMKDFLSVSRDCTVDEARREFEPVLVEKVCSQIDAKKSTIGLVVDDALFENREFAKRASQILELRQKELDSILIPVVRGRTFWDPLYFTAIGYQILRIFGGRMSKNSKDQQTILNAFEEVGIKLEMVDIDQVSLLEDHIRHQLDQLPVSTELRNYIRMLPDCRLPSWPNIDSQ